MSLLCSPKLALLFSILIIALYTTFSQSTHDTWEHERTQDKIYLQHHGIPLQLFSLTTPSISPEQEIIIYSDLNILTRRTVSGNILWKQSSPMNEFPLHSHYAQQSIKPFNSNEIDLDNHIIYTFSLSNKPHFTTLHVPDPVTISPQSIKNTIYFIIARMYSTNGTFINQISIQLPEPYLQYTAKHLSSKLNISIWQDNTPRQSISISISLSPTNINTETHLISIALDFLTGTSRNAFQSITSPLPLEQNQICSITSRNLISIASPSVSTLIPLTSIKLEYFEEDQAMGYSDTDGESIWHPSLFPTALTLPYLYSPTRCWFITSFQSSHIILFIASQDRFLSTFSIQSDRFDELIKKAQNETSFQATTSDLSSTNSETVSISPRVNITSFSFIHLSNENLPFSTHSTIIHIPPYYSSFSDYIYSTYTENSSFLSPSSTSPSKPTNASPFTVSKSMTGSSNPLFDQLFMTIHPRIAIQNRSDEINQEYTLATYYASNMKLLSVIHFSMPISSQSVHFKINQISDQQVCIIAFIENASPLPAPHNYLHCIPFASVLTHNPLPLLKKISPLFKAQMKLYYDYIEQEIVRHHQQLYLDQKRVHEAKGLLIDSLPIYSPKYISGFDMPNHIVPHCTFVNNLLNFHFNSTFITLNPSLSANQSQNDDLNNQFSISMQSQNFIPSKQSLPTSTSSNSICTSIPLPTSIHSPHSLSNILSTPTSFIDVATHTHLYFNVKFPIRSSVTPFLSAVPTVSAFITLLQTLNIDTSNISISNNNSHNVDVFEYVLLQSQHQIASKTNKLNSSKPATIVQQPSNHIILSEDILATLPSFDSIQGLLYLFSSTAPNPGQLQSLQPIILTSLPAQLFSFLNHLSLKIYLPTTLLPYHSLPQSHSSSFQTNSTTSSVSSTPATAPFLFTITFTTTPLIIQSIHPLLSMHSSSSPILFKPHHQFIQSYPDHISQLSIPEGISNKPIFIAYKRFQPILTHFAQSQQIYSQPLLNQYLHSLFVNNCEQSDNLNNNNHTTTQCRDASAKLQDYLKPSSPSSPSSPQSQSNPFLTAIFQFMQVIKAAPITLPTSSIKLEAGLGSPILSVLSLLTHQHTTSSSFSTSPSATILSTPLHILFPKVFPTSTDTSSYPLSDFTLLYTKNRITVIYSPYKSYTLAIKSSKNATSQKPPKHPTYILTIDLYRLSQTPLVIPVSSAIYSVVPLTECTITTSQLSLSSSFVLCYSHIDRRLMQFPAWLLTPPVSLSMKHSDDNNDITQNDMTDSNTSELKHNFFPLQQIQDPLTYEFYLSMDYTLDPSPHQLIRLNTPFSSPAKHITPHQSLLSYHTSFESISVVYHLGVDFYVTTTTADGGFDRLESTGRQFSHAMLIASLLTIFVGLVYCKHQARMTRFRNEWK